MALEYKYSLDVVSILIMLLLFLFLSGKRKVNVFIHKIYNFLVLDTFLTGVFDILLGEAISNIDIYGRWFVVAISTIYILLLLSLTILFTVYILALAGINVNFDRAWNYAVGIPFVIATILMLINIFGGNIQVNQIGSSLLNRKAIIAVLIFSAYYMLLWIIVLLRYRKSLTASKKLYIRMFILVHTFILMVYFVTSFAGFFTFELSLVLLVLIYAVQSPDYYFDKTDAMLYSHLVNNIKLELSRDKAFSLIYINIHDLDVVYDSFGEINANKLLAQATSYLNNIHKSAVVYRVDKNTFVVKISRLDEMSLHAIRSNISNRFKKAFKYGDISTIFTTGMLTINAPEDIKTKEDFDEIANVIKYAIIPIGSDYSYKNLIENDKESEIIEAVKKAVENNGFQVFYQPIYSTNKKKIVAAEALIRLFDDKLGFVSPEIFIPLAEREGYILTIGEFVFTEVCKFYSENDLKKKGIDYIEVNLSAVQCMQHKLADEFIEIMRKYGLNSSQINFEITETSAMQSNNAVRININNFVDHGVDLSLDDYGTGYSNISYLYHLPFAFMKIDKSILWSSDKNDKANITLNNIFKMAKNLKMRIVVEGVETEEHIKKLLKLECDYFQGYYFSKPINGNDFVKYIDNFTVPAVCLS